MDGWIEELVSRGIDRPHASQLAANFDENCIAQAVAYFDSLDNAGPGLLVVAIREGRKVRPRQRSLLDEQKAYGEEILAWIEKHLPDLRRPNPRLVSLHRDLYGDVFADQLAASSAPHPAAIATVIRLHQTEGRHLSPRSHGPMIRQAVIESDREAIAECEELLAKHQEVVR